jgi:hypothetical protein
MALHVYRMSCFQHVLLCMDQNSKMSILANWNKKKSHFPPLHPYPPKIMTIFVSSLHETFMKVLLREVFLPFYTLYGTVYYAGIGLGLKSFLFYFNLKPRTRYKQIYNLTRGFFVLFTQKLPENTVK